MNFEQMLSYGDRFGYDMAFMFVNVVWQSALLYLATLVITYLLRYKKASVRHALWISMIAASALLPVLNGFIEHCETHRADVPLMPLYQQKALIVDYEPDGYESIVSAVTPTPSVEAEIKTAQTPSYVVSYPWAFLAVAYAAIFLYTFLRFGCGAYRERQWKRFGTVVTDYDVISLFKRAALRIGLKRPWTIIESDDLASPVTIGIAHPVIMIPTLWKRKLTVNEMYAAAVHELSHIKRRDSFFFAVVSVLRSAFFFNPFIWLAVQRIAAEAEHACDEAVVEHGSDPLEYTKMLVDLAKQFVRRNEMVGLTAGLLFRKSLFFRRVEMILHMRKSHIPGVSRFEQLLLAILMCSVTTAILYVPLGMVPDTSTASTSIPSQRQFHGEDMYLKLKQQYPGQISGIVRDEEGNPLSGAKVDVWHWFEGHEMVTEDDGRFLIEILPEDHPVELCVTKEGMSPIIIPRQETNVENMDIVMNDDTFIQCYVRDPDGKPLPNAEIVLGITEIKNVRRSFEYHVKTGKDGSFKQLFFPCESCDLLIWAPDIGYAAVHDTSINDKSEFNIDLKQGVDFIAHVANEAGEPASGFHIEYKAGYKGVSSDDGTLTIKNMEPGDYTFWICSDTHARWWSDTALKSYQKYHDKKDRSFQRNFDNLRFAVTDSTSHVDITVESAVTIRGKVFSPDGKPVAGATVSAAQTGTGNSLTGDTRYSSITNNNGSYEIKLPAGKDFRYNLIAHDGKYNEFRQWGNGITKPFITQSGDVIENVIINLTRPAAVSGIVRDVSGKPLANQWVRAHAMDKRGNRYYDPMVKTDENGRFVLDGIRPGETCILGTRKLIQDIETDLNLFTMVTLDSGDSISEIELVGMRDNELHDYINKINKKVVMNKKR